MTLALTVDRRWGGFYIGKAGPCRRICFGFFALDFFDTSLELIHRDLINMIDTITNKLKETNEPTTT